MKKKKTNQNWGKCENASKSLVLVQAPAKIRTKIYHKYLCEWMQLKWALYEGHMSAEFSTSKTLILTITWTHRRIPNDINGNSKIISIERTVCNSSHNFRKANDWTLCICLIQFFFPSSFPVSNLFVKPYIFKP